jgi:hypothetical protein
MDSATEDRSFSAKLLLFGEHVLLLGAPALAVPVAAFGGHWHWSEQRDRHDFFLDRSGKQGIRSSATPLILRITQTNIIQAFKNFFLDLGPSFRCPPDHYKCIETDRV